jgi:hypothetical protein
MQDQNEKDNRLEKGTRRLLEMKERKQKGRVVFYLDGSGKVNDLEIVEKM